MQENIKNKAQHIKKKKNSLQNKCSVLCSSGLTDTSIYHAYTAFDSWILHEALTVMDLDGTWHKSGW